MNKIHCIDALEGLKTLDDECVQCCVTSSPYWGLRDYGTATWEGGDEKCDHETPRSRGDDIKLNDKQGTSAGSRPNTQLECKCGAKRVDKQIGLEKNPEEYIKKMVEIFREVRRVLRKDGTLWLNYGDSYAGSPGGSQGKNGACADRTACKNGIRMVPEKRGLGLKPKDLCGIPWRIAFALQTDGWYLRSDIIWHKPNPMPESVTDRPTKAHEYIFLLTKNQKYFYDTDAVREKSTRVNSGGGHKWAKLGNDGIESWEPNPTGSNKRTVWTVATQPYPDAHFATFPPDLIKPCILAGTSEKGCCSKCGSPWERVIEKGDLVRSKSNLYAADRDERYLKDQGWNREGGFGPGSRYEYKTLGWQPTCECEGSFVDEEYHWEPDVDIDKLMTKPCLVLDPFMGSGTTAWVAYEHGRRYVGFEINPEYIKLCEARLRQMNMFGERA